MENQIENQQHLKSNAKDGSKFNADDGSFFNAD